MRILLRVNYLLFVLIILAVSVECYAKKNNLKPGSGGKVKEPAIFTPYKTFERIDTSNRSAAEWESAHMHANLLVKDSIDSELIRNIVANYLAKNYSVRELKRFVLTDHLKKTVEDKIRDFAKCLGLLLAASSGGNPTLACSSELVIPTELKDKRIRPYVERLSPDEVDSLIALAHASNQIDYLHSKFFTKTGKNIFLGLNGLKKRCANAKVISQYRILEALYELNVIASKDSEFASEASQAQKHIIHFVRILIHDTISTSSKLKMSINNLAIIADALIALTQKVPNDLNSASARKVQAVEFVEILSYGLGQFLYDEHFIEEVASWAITYDKKKFMTQEIKSYINLCPTN